MRRCHVCGKAPQVGVERSHANNRSRRRWHPNLQRARILEDGRARRVRVCTSCLSAGKVEKAG